MSSLGRFYQEFVVCNDHLHAFDAYVQSRGGLRADFETAKTKLFLQPDARTGIDHWILASFSTNETSPKASVAAPKVAVSNVRRERHKWWGGWLDLSSELPWNHSSKGFTTLVLQLDLDQIPHRNHHHSWNLQGCFSPPPSTVFVVL